MGRAVADERKKRDDVVAPAQSRHRDALAARPELRGGLPRHRSGGSSPSSLAS